jgi:hypothetical protein
MKFSAIFLLFGLLLPSSGSHPSAFHEPTIASGAAILQSDRNAPTQTTIEPGLSIGPIKLGDTRARALELFPKKDEDGEWDDKCGSTIDWVDSANRTGHGDLLIRMKKGKVFQIESTTTRFQTGDGITIFDAPEKVAEAYKGMRAYVLLTPPVPALGDRPLIFWLDERKGVVFEFAYYPGQHKRYLYKIVVFLPNKTFCPEQETTGSPKWQGIPPYSLEPPADIALNIPQY